MVCVLDSGITTLATGHRDEERLRFAYTAQSGEQTALREISEETGVSGRSLGKLSPHQVARLGVDAARPHRVTHRKLTRD